MKGKGSVFLLIFVICAIGIVTGLRYYEYTEKDPDFCSMCHIMEEGYRSWWKSKHSHIICQQCHGLNIIEENRLLVAFVAKGNKSVKQTHGRIKPWEGCLDCHTQEAAQGSLTLRVSYGHARHVFMQNLPCKECHRGDLHSFKADRKACQSCHKDKLVHGMGMAGLECLNCHSFGAASPKLVTIERCFECHGDVPKRGVMARIKCFECHHPHGKLRMENKDCLGSCHGNETRVGQHGLHLEKTSMGCIDCHKPHRWMVGKAEAVGLCDRCHPLKDPATFIY